MAFYSIHHILIYLPYLNLQHSRHWFTSSLSLSVLKISIIKLLRLDAKTTSLVLISYLYSSFFYFKLLSKYFLLEICLLDHIEIIQIKHIFFLLSNVPHLQARVIFSYLILSLDLEFLVQQPMIWQRQIRQEKAPSASQNPFFFILALRQGPLSTEQHAMWINKPQIADIDPMQVALILKINKQIRLVNRVWGGWFYRKISLELALNKLNGVSEVNGKVSKGLKHLEKTPSLRSNVWFKLTESVTQAKYKTKCNEYLCHQELKCCENADTYTHLSIIPSALLRRDL